MSSPSKIIPISRLADLSKSLKRKGKKIVTTNGTFDLLHIGHIRNLIKAKTFGDVLIVGVNSDASVKSYKDPGRPIIPARERAEIVSALAPVDYVVIFNEPTPVRWLSLVKPQVHVKGGDWKKETMPEWAVVTQGGGRVVRVPLTRSHSTTRIIELILSKPRA